MGAPAKKGGSGAIIAVVIIVALVVLGGGAVGALYAMGMIGGGDKSKSVAHEHLPKGCEAVIRVDLKGIMAVEAIKQHVIPAIDKQAKDSEDADKMARFLFTAGLDPKKDITEVAVCLKSLDGNVPTAVGVVGGRLKENGIVDAIIKHAKKGEFKDPKDEGGLKVLEAVDDPVFVTQAKDAAVLIGNNLDLVKEASKTGDAHEGYKIPLEEQIVGIITEDAVKKLAGKAGAQNPFGDKMKGAGRMLFTASLDTGAVSARLGMPDEASAKELADAIKGFIDLIKSAPGGSGSSDQVAKELMDKMTIAAEGKELVVKLTVPKKMIEDAAKEMAKNIKEKEKEL